MRCCSVRLSSGGTLGSTLRGGAGGAAPAPPVPSPSAPSAPIQFEFATVGADAGLSRETRRGRATALVSITTFDLASQLVPRRLADALVSFTPRANAAAVVVE